MNINKLLLLVGGIFVIGGNSLNSQAHDWKDVFMVGGFARNVCSLVDDCAKEGFNETKKHRGKPEIGMKKVNLSEKDPSPPIESFDEWTKKRRDAAANQVSNNAPNKPNGQNNNRRVDASPPPPTKPNRNFASKECGAKVIASNGEAENAKSVVNDKDLDDYMRNPCESAKEKYIVIELCEAIQVTKIGIGNFELFASRPKKISVQISERYPPLANWIDLGIIELEDYHKKLQTFSMPQSNIYAKFVKINFDEHYGNEHYCVVSVVNVIGTTLTDEYDKEEAAVHLLNVLTTDGSGDDTSTKRPETFDNGEPLTAETTAIALRTDLKTLVTRLCYQCPTTKETKSWLVCNLLPLKKNQKKEKLKIKERWSSNRSRIDAYFQMRRKNLAIIQRMLPRLKAEVKKTVEKPKSPPPIVEDKKILAGGSSNQLEMVLIKLSKRVAAVEMNLTLSTEYLSALSKQYVSQMSGYEQELKHTLKTSKMFARNVEGLMRAKMNTIRRELRELRASVEILEQIERSRLRRSQIARDYWDSSSCRAQPKHKSITHLEQGHDDEFEILSLKRNLIEWLRNVRETVDYDELMALMIVTNVSIVAFLLTVMLYWSRRHRKRMESVEMGMKSEVNRRMMVLAKSNRMMIGKGMRKAELAVTAAVASSIRGVGRKKNRRGMQLEAALNNLFAKQQKRIDEKFEASERLLKRIVMFENPELVEDSESQSETEHRDETSSSVEN